MSDTSQVVAATSILLVVCLRRKRQRRNRAIWIREWIQQREALGAFHQLLNELQKLDAFSYRNFVTMDAATFEKLLCMVAPMITHKDTVMREAITPGERLAVPILTMCCVIIDIIVAQQYDIIVVKCESL